MHPQPTPTTAAGSKACIHNRAIEMFSFARTAARRAAFAAAVPLTALAASSSSSSCAPANTAIVILGPAPLSADSGARGWVTFKQAKDGSGPVVAELHLKGLTPGAHGFHVHALGDVSQGCVTAGGHFNPQGAKHGGPTDEERHAGDLGNIIAGADGTCEQTIVDSRISLLPGAPNSIVGRSIVVHADADDLGKGGFPDSLTTGHAGARVACGVIGIGAEGDI